MRKVCGHVVCETRLSPLSTVLSSMSEWSLDDPARLPRVAIVGGGPGGLFTAWHLERRANAPLSVTIFEASDRIGGKVCTASFTTAPVRYEAGAAELYDYSPVDDDPLRQLVEQLGLPAVSIAGSAVFVAGRSIANLDDLGDVFGANARREMTAFDTRARSGMTPAEFYQSGSDHAADATSAGRFAPVLDGIACAGTRRYVDVMIHSDLATEPSQTDRGYGLQNYLMNDPAYMRLYCIPGGNEQLMHAIAVRLAAEVRLGSVVTEVGARPDGAIRLRVLAGGEAQVVDYDLVILALPMDALKRLTFTEAALDDAMRGHVEHHDHPAHYLRVSVLLNRPAPTLPGDDAYLMLDAFGGTCLYVESARDPCATHGVLGWLLGGAAAVEMAGLSDEALVATVLDTLPAPLAPCRQQVVEARVHRWTGAVSALPGGWARLPVDRRHRPSPAHPNFFVVGDYLYDSTLNGVLDSAEHVASWVAAEHVAKWEPTRGGRCGTTTEVSK
jgi:monoamine oxidase